MAASPPVWVSWNILGVRWVPSLTSDGHMRYDGGNIAVQMFRSSTLPENSYEVLAHCADQTHAGDIKSEQGYRAMDIVDSDRCEAVREEGYSVTLSKLHPLDCTPKNNLIVGLPLTGS